MSASQRHHIFNENCPRPPVPGEETEVGIPAPGYPYPPPWTFQSKHESPVLTPRRSSLAAGSRPTVADLGAPLGFEPEGSCGGGDTRGRYPHEQPSPPPYMRWAQNLHYLLEDSDGVALFRNFLLQEGQLDSLDFWFACEGLKKSTDRVPQLVKLISKKYLNKQQLAIPDDLRKECNRQVKEAKEIHPGVFDNVQAAVEQLISQTTYPNFLKSDLYLQHVQQMQNGSNETAESGSSSGSNCSRDPPGLGAGCPLPTLHEDAELSISTPVPGAMSASMPPPLRLTKDMLMATERRRATELKPKPEAYAGMYLQRPYHSPFLTHPNNPHVVYNSYNPVSRQDSELQSLSSDARTESDNMSLTDSSIDGMSSMGRSRSSKRLHMKHCRQMKESASMNRDPFSHRTIIPRTQVLPKDQSHSMKPEVFASILIQKLECVKKEQEAQEKLDRKLLDNDAEREDAAGSESGVIDTAVSSRALADALREKLMVEDDNDQAILDQHVSRVWSDLTPSRSPGFSSPRPKSPDMRRHCRPNPTAASTLLPPPKPAGPGGVPHPYQARTSYSSRHVRKEKDVFSTFSSDSGNVHDYMEGSEHKHHVPKSKSVPDYAETLKQDWEAAGPSRYRERVERGDRMGTGRRSCSSRKTLTDQTDSGVSVVSDTPPVLAVAGVSGVPGVPSQMKDSKVLSWLLESEREKQHTSTGEGSWHARSESSSKHRVRDSVRDSPITSRHSRKSGAGPASTSGTAHGAHSRSDSLERGAVGLAAGLAAGMAVGPAQPFVADPSMPPLPQPHTATQLEEARRRLMDEGHRQRPRYGVGNKVESSHSNPSTLRRTSRPGNGRGDSQIQQDHTTVVFTFCDEQFPYRTKIPSRPVTLRQFKEYLPKKGNYRYFFKTECEELDMKVIQEEITDDNDVVPLWEGKIMAQVKPVE